MPEQTATPVPGSLTPEVRAAERFLASLRKRYAGEDKTVYVNGVPLKDLAPDAAGLIIRDLLERLDVNLGMDVATYPGPSTPSWAIREAVAEEREACAALAERLYYENSGDADCFPKIHDDIRARK